MPPEGGNRKEKTVKKETHHLHIELSQDDYQLLCERSKQCGLSMRSYLCRLIRDQPVKARPSEEIRRLRGEINHIGSNINQIARKANAGIATREDIQQVHFLLRQIYELMYQVANL